MTDIDGAMLAIFLLIVASGIFSMTEMALISARKSRLREMIKKGRRGAKTALELALAPDQFLPAIQIGVTLFGILAGVVAGRAAAPWLAGHIETAPWIGLYHQELALLLVVLTVAVFSLIFGAMAPKRLALRNPEAIASSMSCGFWWIAKISSPMVHLLNALTDAMWRLFTKQQVSEPPVTEEEIKLLVRQGTKAGVFDESAQNMVEAVLRLGDETARALMTPRTQIAWLDLSDSPDGIREKIIAAGHSRFPVASGGLDKVEGSVLAKDLLVQSLGSRTIDLKSLMQPALFVPRAATPLEVLELFKKTGQQLALVVDEYGGVEGLLTHHDLLEAIAGDIPFDGKPSNPRASQRHDGSWLLDGMLSVDEFKEVFHLQDLPGENRDAYQTLGGFVFTRMGRIPAVSDSFEWNGLRFEIVDMDGKRIDKLLVSRCGQRDGTVGATGDRDSNP
jgi:putative hemolysin